MPSSRPLKVRSYEQIQDHAFSEEKSPRLVLSLDGSVVYANAAMESLCGLAPLGGQDFLMHAEFIDPDEAFRSSSILAGNGAALMTALRSGVHEVGFARTGVSTQLQFDLVKSKNGEDYVVASGFAGGNDLSSSLDELLSQPPASSDDFSPFMDMSDQLFCLCNSDGHFQRLNARFEDLLGFRTADLEGRSLADLVHPEEQEQIRQLMSSLSPANDKISFDCRVMSNEAQVFWMSWTHRYDGGRVYSAGRDITDVKKHQQDMERREAQLSEAEAIGKMGHWHWTSGKQDIRFSDEIYRMFGVERETFTPTLDSVNAMLHRRDAGRMIQAFQRAIIEQNDHEVDFRVTAPNGEIRHVRCQGRCEFDSEGDVTGLYGIMQDVTQAMQQERALRDAKESAERAYASKSQFLANMSHELRTPLNAIIGFSEMMQQQLLGPIGNERYLDYIKGIRESGEHLLDLITDILDMSKIEAGKYTLDVSTFNLSKVIRLAVHMMEARASDRKISIVPKFADETISITADRRAVMQIMLNILSNAVKFSHAGGAIELECLIGGTHASVRITDHGIGIPANKLKTITNPFEQAANQYTRSHEGTGLGLSITKELAELHGGTIFIESAVDAGTTVTVRLPLDTSVTRKDAGSSGLIH